MCSCASQFEDKDVFVNLVDEKAGGYSVTFAIVRTGAGECRWISKEN